MTNSYGRQRVNQPCAILKTSLKAGHGCRSTSWFIRFEMESSQPPISNQLTDVIGLRQCGLFLKGNEPSIGTLRNWTKLRRIPYHKVGHFPVALAVATG